MSEPKIEVKTFYEANLGPPSRSYIPPHAGFNFMGHIYPDSVRIVLMWILENMPRTTITTSGEAEHFIIAGFASEADATAFKIRWG